jgi:prolyl 4-hydroxylase
VLSRIENPFILYLDNVLSSEECDELLSLSKGQMQPSRVVDPTTGEEKATTGRTSKGMY